MFFCVITNNINWETYSAATFKISSGVKDENFNAIGVHWEIKFLREISQKTITYRGELPKKGGLNSVQI